MIGISTQTYDLNGTRIFRQADYEAELANLGLSRRVTRTATLDGGVAITDSGAVHGDRDISVKEPDADEEAVAWGKYIVENYGLVTVTMSDGAYSGVPSDCVFSGGMMELKIMLTEKLSA